MTRSQLFLDVAAEVFGHGHCLRFRAHGNSMYPTIRDGESIVVEPAPPANLRRDDVALYRAERGITAHRIVAIESVAGSMVFVTRGDAMDSDDEPVDEARILGKVIAVGEPSRPIEIRSGRAKMKSVGWSSMRWLRGRAKTLLKSSLSAFGRAKCGGIALAMLALTAVAPVSTKAQVSVQALPSPSAGSSSTSGTNVTFLSLDLTGFSGSPSGSANYLVVAVAVQGSTTTPVSAVKWEGTNTGCPSTGSPQSFTQGSIANGNANGTVTIFYLKNPTPATTSGQTCNVDVTFSGANQGISVGAVMFSNVSSSTGPTFPTSANGNSGTPGVTITVPTSPSTGAALVAIGRHGFNNPCPSLASSTSNPTLQFTLAATSATCNVDKATLGVATATTSGTVNFNTTSTEWGVAGIQFTSASAITAVKVHSFTAAPDEDGNVIELKTGRDVNNLGFNLYRSDKGGRVKLNASLLAGTALMAGASTTFTAGQTRRWYDEGAGPGVAYWVEEVDLSGKKTLYGPAVAQSASRSAAAWVLDDTAQTLRAKPAPTGRASALDASTAAIPLANVGSISSALMAASMGNAPTSVRAKAAVSFASAVAAKQQFALAAGPAVRLGVKTEGWYRVTQPQLVAAGMSPGVDPRKLQLYLNGVEQAIYVDGEADGVLDPQDSVYFYGTGLDTIWTDTQVYWLVAGSGKGKRANISGSLKGSAASASFPSTVDWEPRTVYFTALLNGDGNNFFGPVVTDTPVTQDLTVANLYAAGGPSTLRVTLQGATAGPHSVAVSLNGAVLGNVSFQDQASGMATFTVPSINPGANTLALVAASPDDVSVVDDVQLTYPHSYKADGDVLRFTALPGKLTTIGGFTSTPITAIDITDPANISLVVGATTSNNPGYELTLVPPGSGNNPRTMLAVTGVQVRTPTIAANQPSSWHAPQAGYDMVILAHSSLMSSASRLAAHRQAQGLAVAVIDVQDLYDEFNFGAKSPYALKNFLSMTRTSWSRKPSFVLLLGNGTFDPRNYLGTPVPDLVPAKLIDTALLETASDDWFVDFDNDGVPDVAIGRLPATSTAEADLMVSRIIAYDRPGSDPWRTRALLVTGRDQDPGDDFARLTAGVRTLLPGSISVTNLVQSSDPNPAGNLVADINAGQGLVNYMGHGSNEVWASLFDSGSALQLTNGAMTPVFLSMTCLNGYFQDVYTNALGKALLSAPSGGAVAVWASSGLTESDQQSKIGKAMVGALYGPNPLTLGAAAAAAKAATTNLDVRRTWILLGDPSMVAH
jgi:hypothetical protein